MPHHVLAMGTMLAALGAKAASAGVDPAAFISSGAAPLGKGVGSALLSLKTGKLAAASAPAASTFLAKGGDAAAGVAATSASMLASKGTGAAISGVGGKSLATSLLAKKTGGTVGTSLAKVGSGVGVTRPSFLKVSQKACFAKKGLKTVKSRRGHSVARNGLSKAKAHVKQNAKQGVKSVKKEAKTAGRNEGKEALKRQGAGSRTTESEAAPLEGRNHSGGAPMLQGASSRISAGFFQTHMTSGGASGGAASGISTHTSSAVGPLPAHHPPGPGAVAAADQAGSTGSGFGGVASGDGVLGPGAAGLGSEAVADTVEKTSSGGGGLVGGLMRGALGMEEEGDSGILHSISHRAGSRIFENLFGGSDAGTVGAILGGAGAGAAMGDMDPSALDVSEDVEEQTMAVTALLPMLFSKVSLNGKEDQETRKYTRSASVDSTSCGSDSGLSEAGGTVMPTSRRVMRSHASRRKAVYSKFLC